MKLFLFNKIELKQFWCFCFLRLTFRRFAPNVSEVSEEFQRLAAQFNVGGLPEYAGLCFMGASKCEKMLNNPIFETHLLLKAARAFVEADKDNLCLRSNEKPYLQGALTCYNTALMQLDDNSILKAAVIREMKQVNSNCEITSNFVSPAHRAHELDLAAIECIQCGNFECALEKITEVYDDVSERKVKHFYEDVLRAHEVTIILLILLLELPSARQSPSNIKLYESFANGPSLSNLDGGLKHQSTRIVNALSSLIAACKFKQYITIVEREIPSIAQIPGLKIWQHILLEKLKEKYIKLM